MERQVKITNKNGIHARPCALIVSISSRYKSSVLIKKGNKCIDAKNMLEVLSSDICPGDTITVIADGTDEKEALEELVNLINNNFDED